MEVTSRNVGGVIVLSVSGAIDGLAADALFGALGGQIRDGHTRLVADLSGVNYTGSAGLRALLVTLKDARRGGGDLYLSAVQPEVLRVLELSDLTSILKLYPDVETAVASFRSSAPAR